MTIMISLSSSEDCVKFSFDDDDDDDWDSVFTF
jgi:hypothetical protein